MIENNTIRARNLYREKGSTAPLEFLIWGREMTDQIQSLKALTVSIPLKKCG